jgi:mannose-6-phosphate isomerase-like protein (cupin superfamily)
MPVLLEGGCRVAEACEGEPRRREGLSVWRHAGRDLGSSAISLRIVELGPGAKARFRSDASDEVLYVLDGAGAAEFGGGGERISADTGLYIPAGTWLAVRNAGTRPLLLASAQCPDPGAEAADETSLPSGPRGVAIVRLGDLDRETTADRWYRVVIGERQGSTQVTQFVGGIPPGRAPDHFHQYEEVLVILSGSGRMWAGSTHTAIGPGSCVFLPRVQVHCVENTGSSELRLLGVFFPAGSPAARQSAG